MTTPAGLLPTAHPCPDAPPGPIRFPSWHEDTAAELTKHWPFDKQPLGCLGLLGVRPQAIKTLVGKDGPADEMIEFRTQIQALLYKRRTQLPADTVGSKARAAARRGPDAVAGVLAKPMKQAARRNTWAVALRYVAELGGSMDELAERIDRDAASAGQGAPEDS
jgi:hypothetical protein